MSLTPISKTEYGSYLRNSTSSMRKFVTKLDRKGAILPVLLLEATVTGGRTYQAYKRDGFVEARERVTEETPIAGRPSYADEPAQSSFFDKDHK